MASNYTVLGIQLMTTGEKAGLWGGLTNTNWDIMEQISGGFTQQAVTDGADTDLSVSDGSTGATLAHRIIEFTGTLSASRNVTIPIDVQTFYIIKNSCTDSVVFKYVSGSGNSVTFASGDTKIVYATANDGTNPDLDEAVVGGVTPTNTVTLTNKTLTAPKFADGGFIADANGAEALVFGAASTAVNELKITNAATGAGPTLSSVSTSGTDTNIDINVTPAGTGDVVLAGDTVKVGDAAAAATLTSNGAGSLTVTTGGTEDLVLSTNSGTNSSTLTITDGANGNVTITPNGTAELVVAGNSGNAGTLTLDADTDDTGAFSASFAPGVLTESTDYTLPTAYAGATGYVLTSTDAGVLSWAEAAAGGTSWQAVVVASGGSSTAVAGEGYFINTTAGTHTLNLPTSPSLGDEVNVIDYAGTFDTNNLTVGRGGEKIHGSAADLTVATERAGFCLVYTDGTQGWLLKDK